VLKKRVKIQNPVDVFVYFLLVSVFFFLEFCVAVFSFVIFLFFGFSSPASSANSATLFGSAPLDSSDSSPSGDRIFGRFLFGFLQRKCPEVDEVVFHQSNCNTDGTARSARLESVHKLNR
jgi:hypothetical protein